MRYVTALFDAPIPATAALAALTASGFTPEDIAVVPSLPGLQWSPTGPFLVADAEPQALMRDLGEMGVAPGDVELYAEGVRRGGILVVVRAPTLSTPAAEEAILSTSPPELAAHVQRWEASPGLRYSWEDTPPPIADPPPAAGKGARGLRRPAVPGPPRRGGPRASGPGPPSATSTASRRPRPRAM